MSIPTTGRKWTSLNRSKDLLIGDNKSRVLDGIPNRALKSAPKIRVQHIWIMHGGRSATCCYFVVSLYVLDTMGKMLGRVICNWMLSFIKSADGLSEQRYIFRSARSTVNAIATVAAREVSLASQCRHPE